MYGYNNLSREYKKQAYVTCSMLVGIVYVDVLYQNDHRTYVVASTDIKNSTSLRDLLQGEIEETCGMLESTPDIVWFYYDHPDDVPAHVSHAYRQLCAALGPAQSAQTALLVTEQELFNDSYGQSCLVALQDQYPWNAFIADIFPELLQDIVDQSELFRTNARIHALKPYLADRAIKLSLASCPIGPMHKVETLVEVVAILDLLNIFRIR